MKNKTLHREDYEAVVFSETPSISEQPSESALPEKISFIAEDGSTYVFFPLGIFTVNEKQYMLVQDSDKSEGDVHILYLTEDENGSPAFHTVSDEEFQEVMEDFEKFISHISQEDQN